MVFFNSPVGYAQHQEGTLTTGSFNCQSPALHSRWDIANLLNPYVASTPIPTSAATLTVPTLCFCFMFKATSSHRLVPLLCTNVGGSVP